MEIHHFVINVHFEVEWYLKAGKYKKFFAALKTGKELGIDYIGREECKDESTDLSFFIAAISESEAENTLLDFISKLQKEYPGICYFP